MNECWKNHPFYLWCEKYLPIYWNEGLSLDENIGRFTCVVNELIKFDKELLEAYQDVITQFGDLKSYVENYFDSLNVTTAINNKIDSMAESGELTDLISSKLLTGIYKKIINVLSPPESTDLPLVNDWTANSFTDNTSRFQALIDKYGQGVLYFFPDGIYGFSGSVTIPHGFIALVGTNYNYCRIRLESTTLETLITIGSSTAMTPYVTIENIGFIDSYAYASNKCITVKNPRTMHVKNVLFQDFMTDLYITADYASSGQTSILEWCTHNIENRQGMNRFVFFNSASSTIFPNGFYIHHNHGSFGGAGIFVYGYGCDMWINDNNIANCVNAINMRAANERIGGDMQIRGNVFADSTGTAIYLLKYNRGVIIDNNLIEEKATNDAIFSAMRFTSCNGVIVTSNCVGTERTAIGLNHNIGFILLDGTIANEYLISNNICYLGSYVITNVVTNATFIKVVNNIFRHIGDNTTQSNAFYINNTKNSIYSDNVIDYDAVNSAYTLTNVYGINNLYRGTLNLPFNAENNYLYSN